MKKRAKFNVLNDDEVELTYYESFLDDMKTRRFFRPWGGGYVREVLSNGATRQVCDRLALFGSTLTCDVKTPLAKVIRREYRAMKQAEDRWMWKHGYYVKK